MAEIELVIKIPEKLYNRFGHEYSEENLISKYTNDAILEAFCNSTPLLKGHWIDTGSGQECSECGEIQYSYDNFRHFCANCGARMDWSQESEDK